MEFNVADLFEGAADRIPEREILVCGDRRASMRELDSRANRLAHVFLSLGLGKEDHIGIYAFNSMQWVEAMLAAFKIRAIPININYRYVEDELRYLFTNADLVALVHQQQFAPRVAAVRKDVPTLRHCIAFADGTDADSSTLDVIDYEDAVRAAPPERDFEPRSGQDTYILYTGGTTGMPKGVMWHHKDVIFTLGGGIDPMSKQRAERPEALLDKINPDSFLVQCPLAPLMHGAAQWAVLGQMFVGNKIVLMPGSFDPHRTWETVAREKINSLLITGDAVARPLVEALDERDYDLSSLMVLSSSAAVFSPSVKLQFLDRLPNLFMLDAHGASEQGLTGLRIVTKESVQDELSQPPTGRHGLRIDPDPDVAVFDDNLQRVESGSGSTGKLARSGNVPYGYYKDQKKSAEVFVKAAGRRWSMPGDLATVEDDGTIVMLGRGSTSINSGGEKIYPEEVEAALKSHPAIFDALVVGVPDERWGERVAAVVQLRPGMTWEREEADSHCRTRLAGYKTPREYHIVDAIKRSPSGKPNYPWAKDLAVKDAPEGRAGRTGHRP